MSGVFTPQRREEVYQNLLEQLINDARITGIITFGAENNTFTDDYDGIELLVIIEKPSIIDIVFTLWVKRLRDMFNDQSSFDPILDNDLHTAWILLDDYLKIGLQFRAVNRFHLVGTDWCVSFDREGYIAKYLETRTMTREQYIQTLYENHMKGVWKPIVSCVTAIRRGNLWRAVSELENLRTHLVEIAGLNHLQFTHGYQNMNNLPEMFLIQLRHTLPTNITDKAIRRSLHMGVQMLFQEAHILDQRYNTTYTQQLEVPLMNLVELYG